MSTFSPQTLLEAEAYWDKLCQLWGVEANGSSQFKVEALRQISSAALLESAFENQIFMMQPIAEDVTMTMETVVLPPVDLRRQIKPVDYTPIEVMIGADQSALLAGIVRFRSDAVFDLAIHRTRRWLSAQRRNKYGDAATVQPYSIEFGNPFPGTKRGCAHHCVELISQFDAFHDALVDADKGILKPYAEPSAKPSPGQRTEPTDRETTADTKTSTLSHIHLVHRFQNYWIGFIVGTPVQKVAEGEIFVWGTAGTTRVDRLAETPKWVERMARLKLLELNISSMFKVLRTLDRAFS